MSDGVLLVRHTAVALAWQGRCYGASDVPLSRAGLAATIDLSAQLAARRPAWVMHSGLARTRILAERIAKRAGCPLHEASDWRERDFGTWEGQSWNAIYRASGNAMDGMIDAPGAFKPGGGETTYALADRVIGAWQQLPGQFGIVVSHGGPIAALVGRQRRTPVGAWPTLIPPYGGIVTVPRAPRRRSIVTRTVRVGEAGPRRARRT